MIYFLFLNSWPRYLFIAPFLLNNLTQHATFYLTRASEKMGNSVSQTTKSTVQCVACHNWFSTHELNQVQLCTHDFYYISTLLKGEAFRDWSKKQIGAFILLISFGSYYLGKSSSGQKIESLTNSGKDFYRYLCVFAYYRFTG